MAVEEVACPHCGHVTMATVPQDGQVEIVRQNSVLKPNRSDATCKECGESFIVEFKRV